MTCYIAMSGRPDLAAIAREAARGERPRHAIGQLAALLNAEVVQPDHVGVSVMDRLRARLAGRPEHWALARALRRRLAPGDTVYCTDEAIGFPIAAVCARPGEGARVMVCVHNIVRPRARLAFLLFGLARRIAFMAVARPQIRFLQAQGVPSARALLFTDQTDLAFFRPGPGAHEPRPVLMSIGLEQRDYRTLATATAVLDVEVRISGFSTDARALADAFPPELPANMTRGFYAWPDLLALYRAAAVVVVSLKPNLYAAGVQALLEAIACRRPVIVTRTEGLADYLDRPDLVTTVAPQDADGMRSAIRAKLANPAAAQAQADAAHHHYRDLIDSEAYVRRIADAMRALAAA